MGLPGSSEADAVHKAIPWENGPGPSDHRDVGLRRDCRVSRPKRDPPVTLSRGGDWARAPPRAGEQGAGAPRLQSRSGVATLRRPRICPSIPGPAPGCPGAGSSVSGRVVRTMARPSGHPPPPPRRRRVDAEELQDDTPWRRPRLPPTAAVGELSVRNPIDPGSPNPRFLPAVEHGLGLTGPPHVVLREGDTALSGPGDHIPD